MFVSRLADRRYCLSFYRKIVLIGTILIAIIAKGLIEASGNNAAGDIQQFAFVRIGENQNEIDNSNCKTVQNG